MGQAATEGLVTLRGRQHGAFTRRQATAAGFTSRQVDHRIATGVWVPLHRGVYRDVSTAPTDLQSIMAACLACGAGAVASGLSAGAVWSLDVPAAAVPEVAVPYPRNPRSPEIRVRRSRLLGPADAVVHQGIPVTAPLRTLVDLSGALGENRLELVLDQALRRKILALDRLAARLDDPSLARLPGCGTLRFLVAVRKRATGSELEIAFFAILRSAGLPLPEMQYPIRTRRKLRRVDFVYPEQRIVVEVDGYESHASRERFDDDRLRRNELRELGWEVVQVTWTMIEFSPLEVVLTAANALGLTPARWRRA